ncbi:MAG: branched-chain amino acid ABC transporter permease [Candidatus Bathyarchaeota archaeon]|nr:branched-chain amino acid ABC transporter permease [Candidatus Bathyarchaeota archaeon]
MLPVAVIGTVMYASVLVLLCVGFTFTHMIEKFPNLAHTSYASIGTVFSFVFVRLWGLNPYLAWPFAALFSGLLAIALYMIIVQPMQRAGVGSIQLTFAMFALTFVINALIAIFSYRVMVAFRFRTFGFVLRGYDFTFMGHPGVLMTAPLIAVTIVVLIHLFLTRTKFGIAIRASTEDPKLASSLGVNIFHVHITSWFLTGALAGLAGAVIPLWYSTRLGGSDELMINVLAGSVLGGLDSIYGAVLGGAFLAYTQRLMPGMLVRAFGVWVANYIPLMPIIVVVSVLLLMPDGIAGVLMLDSGLVGRLKRRMSGFLGRR